MQVLEMVIVICEFVIFLKERFTIHERAAYWRACQEQNEKP
jgi:hypothetical protein